MPVTLDQLVERVDRDYRAASESIDFFPKFIDPNAPNSVAVAFTDGVRNVPTLKALTAAIDSAAMTSSVTAVKTQVDQLDTLTQGMISALYNLGAKDGPTWRSYNLTDGATAADTSDIMYAANVDKGIRYPFDAHQSINMERKNSSDWTMIGTTLLPVHTDVAVNGFTGSIGTVATTALNVSQYPAFQQTVVTYSYNYYSGYYGYYYYWYYGYYGYYYSYYSQSANVSTVFTPLSGSQTAQTFQVTEPKILKGLRLWTSTAGSGLTAPPVVLITEASLGMPDTAKVIGRAEVVANAAYVSGQGSTASSLTDTAYTSFNLAAPVYLQTGKTYAFVVVVPNGASYNLYTTSNGFSRGGTFYTQDGAMWTQDLAKDLLFSLVTAAFTAGEQYVELKELSVSGGIGSLKTKMAAIVPDNCTATLQIQINGIWRDIDVVNTIASLAAYAPVRMKITATTTAAPLLDTEHSSITAFRPAVNLRYKGISRTISEPGKIRVSVSAMGFELYNAANATGFHTIAFSVKCGTSTTLYNPTLVRPVYGSNKTAQFEVTFNVPATETNYKLSITATTQIATKVFDITSVVEM